jgi:uncharacterized repeat protein (TIGR03803 family)
MSKKIIFAHAVSALLAMMLAASGAFAGTEKVLYSFTGGTDGQFPNSGVVFDQSGNLFGTTSSGGTGGYGGVVFELTPDRAGGWTEIVLHTFGQNGITDGYSASGSLVFDKAGNLYGTTTNGGLHSAGVVYELSPVTGGGWTYSVIHNFGVSKNDGGAPTGVTIDSVGSLYGTTYSGGVHGGGVAYQLTPGTGAVWTQSILHSFPSNSSDGSHPSTALVFDALGNLYGATEYGGYSGTGGNIGTVFKLSHTSGIWGETVIHRFSGRQDGISPSGALALDANGNVYGTTLDGPLVHPSSCIRSVGCGTVFKLTPGSSGWNEASPFPFPLLALATGLAVDGVGNLYATEWAGNRIMELSPVVGGWSPKSLYNFTGGTDGKLPRGTIVFDGSGNLYGATQGGGQYGAGVLFEITP